MSCLPQHTMCGGALLGLLKRQKHCFFSSKLKFKNLLFKQISRPRTDARVWRIARRVEACIKPLPSKKKHRHCSAKSHQREYSEKKKGTDAMV